MTAGRYLAQAEVSECRRVAAFVDVPISPAQGVPISAGAAHDFTPAVALLMSLLGKSVMGIDRHAARLNMHQGLRA